MEARLFRLAVGGFVGNIADRSHSTKCSSRLIASTLLFVLLGSTTASAQAQLLRSRGILPRVREHVAHSDNFIVFASSPEWAAQIAQAAEKNRRELSKYWLGHELPRWSERCPVHVTAGTGMLASGETRFSPVATGVGNWMMTVKGTPERVLDSVLPHEISHTIIATHFAAFAQRGKFVPRWADEGACTTVEHESEKRKHRHYLNQFLQTGRGLAFNKMFSLKEYPHDILPLYAQGHSAVQFLIDQGGPREFIQFLEQGMETGGWEQSLRDHYSYETLGEFQMLWNKWLFDGSPAELVAYSPKLQSSAQARLASSRSTASDQDDPNRFRNAQLDGKVRFAIGNTDPAPVSLAGNLSNQVPSAEDASWYKGRLREMQKQGQSRSSNDSGLASQATQQDIRHSNTNPNFGGVQSPAMVPFASRQEQMDTRPLPSTLAGPEPSHPAQAIAQQNPAKAMAFDTRPNYATSRPQPPQSTQVQVLDWGNSMPIQSGQYGSPVQIGAMPLGPNPALVNPYGVPNRLVPVIPRTSGGTYRGMVPMSPILR